MADFVVIDGVDVKVCSSVALFVAGTSVACSVDRLSTEDAIFEEAVVVWM